MLRPSSVCAKDEAIVYFFTLGHTLYLKKKKMLPCQSVCDNCVVERHGEGRGWRLLPGRVGAVKQRRLTFSLKKKTTSAVWDGGQG